jgi:hypothetical protein
VKPLRNEAEHSAPYSVKAKNEWNYNSPYALRAGIGRDLHLLLPLTILSDLKLQQTAPY